MKLYDEFGRLQDINYIKVINGRWTLNGKQFNEMSLRERQTVDEKIKQLN